ncbi:hypothetical protein Scep_000923 [Stephania cephalantha]|uniref:Uncharacterized protein n=1 Tax=Stephania cephalantha TaxID=152367 RepID=A0AAP0L6Z3_9MAGN
MFHVSMIQVEQLHRIFKLCGSPSEDYWKKLKLPTSFRPPQPYKPSLIEAFRDFPASSLGLLTTLLALDPSYRGTAASALQSEFFTTSPLACSLSELPKVYQEEDDPAHVYRKKNRSSKNKHSRAHRERSRAKAGSTEKSKGDSGLSKEEKNSHETGGSTTRNFSNARPKEGSSPSAFYPVRASIRKDTPRTDCHPNATKNIKNMPPLPTNNTGNVKYNERNNFKSTLERRSMSTRDFRRLDRETPPKRYVTDD